MKQVSLRALGTLALLFLFGCAGAHKVPSIDGDELPQVKFSAMRPRILAVIVKNKRNANAEKKNTEEVEKALTKTIADSLARSGIAVKVGAPNQLRIMIADYDGTGDQGECVKVGANLAFSRGQAFSESYACHVLKHWLGFKMGGSVEEAYKSALGMALRELDKQVGGPVHDASL